MPFLRFILLCLLLAVSNAYAANTSCPFHFAAGEAPEFTNQKLATNTFPLCYDQFAVIFSGLSHTPMWSAEHLTKSRIAATKGIPRRNAFHPETRIPAPARSELNDYRGSGYDRGHMSPSGDMGTPAAQQQSFSLANMVPQDSNNNQVLWEGVESSVRDLATSGEDLYVITGPIFDGSSIQRLNGRVFIPTYVFKAVFDAGQNKAAAYIAPNKPGMDYETVSIAELEKRIGINLFPKMSAQVKASKMNLPAPTPHGHQRSSRRR